MQWNGLDSLPWLWLPFKTRAFAMAAMLIVPTAIAAALAWLVFPSARRRSLLRDHHPGAGAGRAPHSSSVSNPTPGASTVSPISPTRSASRWAIRRTQLGLYWVTLAVLALTFIGG